VVHNKDLDPDLLRFQSQAQLFLNGSEDADIAKSAARWTLPEWARPVVDMLGAARLGCDIAAVMIRGGNAASEGNMWSVPKRDLLAAAQVMLERGELKLAAGERSGGRSDLGAAIAGDLRSRLKGRLQPRLATLQKSQRNGV
jgi:hypothetical protein